MNYSYTARANFLHLLLNDATLSTRTQTHPTTEINYQLAVRDGHLLPTHLDENP